MMSPRSQQSHGWHTMDHRTRLRHGTSGVIFPGVTQPVPGETTHRRLGARGSRIRNSSGCSFCTSGLRATARLSTRHERCIRIDPETIGDNRESPTSTVQKRQARTVVHELEHTKSYNIYIYISIYIYIYIHIYVYVSNLVKSWGRTASESAMVCKIDPREGAFSCTHVKRQQSWAPL